MERKHNSGGVMAGQHLVLQNRKSIVAAALIGLGLLILFLNVGEAATLVRSLRIVGHEADSLGILTATAMAVRRTLQAYLFNHTEFLRVLYEVLLSFSGMLLIVTGTVFFAVIFAAGGKAKKRKRACRFRCLSFDAWMEARLSRERATGSIAVESEQLRRRKRCG